MDPRSRDLFFELHDGLERQAPGDDASTRRALAAMSELPREPRILDLGCGPGAHSILLARETGGSVLAVDLHRPFLDEVERRARAAGVADRVRTSSADMGALEVDGGSFDVVWAEGSIYWIGFDRALERWRPLLAPGGYLAVSEAVWLTDDPPERVRAFWAEAYPAMRGVGQNVAALESLGFEVLTHFVLPESSWWEAYYGPLEERLAALRKRHAADEWAQSVLDAEHAEIELYRDHADCYGYAFFVARRSED